MLKFITSNKNKFYEVSKFLSPIKIEQLSVSLDEIQELDPHKVIEHKLKQALKHHEGPFLVEDTSLFLECFDYKLPGPFVVWFNKTIANKGYLELTKKLKKKKLVYKVIIGYAKNSKNIKFFEGVTKGKIVEPRGKSGFGFDPIIKPAGSNKTLAQLKSADDFKFSSRYKAVVKLKKYLSKRA